MGLGQRIAFTGGGIIAAILLIAYIATKTDILQRFTQGLKNIGLSIGQGVGGGLANIPRGVIEGSSQSFLEAGNADPLGLKAAWNDFLKQFGLKSEGGGITGKITEIDPTSDDSGSGGYYNPAMADNSIVLPADRIYSDTKTTLSNYAKSLGFTGAATRNIKKVSISGTGKASVTRTVKKGSSSISRSAAGQKAQANSRARAAARKKSRSCYNEDAHMGGVGKIDYQLAGLVNSR